MYIFARSSKSTVADILDSKNLSVLFVSTPSPKAISILTRSVCRAQKLFNLNPNWVNATLEDSIPSDIREDVVYRSLVQSDVIFSSEGLTLLAIDHCYSLKSTLDRIARGSWDLTMADAVDVLRRLVYVSRGRPMTRGYLRQCYPEIQVSDNTLLRLNAEFESRFGTRGVVGVNDEYIGWRRDGLTWSPEMEDYGSQLGYSISRTSSAASHRSEWEKQFAPPPHEQPDDMSIAYIFSNKVGFI